MVHLQSRTLDCTDYVVEFHYIYMTEFIDKLLML